MRPVRTTAREGEQPNAMGESERLFSFFQVKIMQHNFEWKHIEQNFQWEHVAFNKSLHLILIKKTPKRTIYFKHIYSSVIYSFKKSL